MRAASAAAACLAIAAGAAVLLHRAGRSWLCPCGTVRLWEGAVHSPENSQQLFDWYSLSHLVHGLLFYAAGWLALRRWPRAARLVIAVAAEAGWEVLENSPAIIDRYRQVTLAWGYSGDSVLNSMADIGCMAAGFLLAGRLPWRASVALGLALELTAVIAIRDNLLLNVLMLVWPIAAIRAWQAAL